VYKGVKHDKIMIVGSGPSLNTWQDQILKFIKKEQCTLIGVNKMTSLCHPDYHLWTNKQRYRDLGGCINPKKSTMMFGHGIPKKLIRKHFKGDYISVVYSNDKRYSERPRLKEKHLRGGFRTAGVLAIAIAYLMEGKQIWVVGMDGYTLQPKSRLIRHKRSQHCYGSGFTDDASWEKCLEKDRVVSQELDCLSKFVAFEILTPTKFKKHYRSLL